MGTVAPECSERRSEPRQVVKNVFVKLDLGKGTKPISCFVWDMSEKGARLKLAEPANLPRVVKVMIGNVSKAASVIWTQADHVGLEFLSR